MTENIRRGVKERKDEKERKKQIWRSHEQAKIENN